MGDPKPISLNALKELLSTSASIKIIDIRSPEEYEKQHIPIAGNIPAETLHSINFSPEDTIICVCNHGKQRSQNAAALVNGKGYENAFYLEGGTATWFDENIDKNYHY